MSGSGCLFCADNAGQIRGMSKTVFITVFSGPCCFTFPQKGLDVDTICLLGL